MSICWTRNPTGKSRERSVTLKVCSKIEGNIQHDCGWPVTDRTNIHLVVRSVSKSAKSVILIFYFLYIQLLKRAKVLEITWSNTSKELHKSQLPLSVSDSEVNFNLFRTFTVATNMVMSYKQSVHFCDTILCHFGEFENSFVFTHFTHSVSIWLAFLQANKKPFRKLLVKTTSYLFWQRNGLRTILVPSQFEPKI